MAKTKGQFGRTVAAKALLFLTINIAIITAFMCCVIAGACVSEDLYAKTDEEYFEETDQEMLKSCVMQTANNLLSGYYPSIDGLEVAVTDVDGNVITETAGYSEAAKYSIGVDYNYPVELVYNRDGEFRGTNGYIMEDGDKIVKANIVAWADPSDFTAHSEADKMIISTAYSLRYAVFPIAIVCFLVGIAAYIALICVAGRHPGTDVVTLGPLGRVPFDVLAFVTLFCCMILYIPIRLSENMVQVFFFCTATFCLVNAVLGLTMSLAARVKRHELIKGTLIYMLFSVVVMVIKAIPLVWRTLLILIGLTLIEGVIIAVTGSRGLAMVWVLEKIVLCPIVLYIAFMLQRLKKAGSKLASGDIGTPVETKGLVLDFRQHADNLNKVSDAVGLAVDQKLKSERMKTELITNVSHDIKTPLTSIINYASLMGTCDPADPKMHEYSEVVVRQSDKLKRLIEDLVEASKASTGNLEIIPAPLDCCTFVSQTAGEFKEKLDSAGLTLVTTAPEPPVTIMADGRRMMRIYDNLMNNICKYSQPGTRVYLTLSIEDGRAVTVFKNTSAAELNITADELVERFVRGDSSRNTEGNGLGLSIAKSMTELQGGTFDIEIDGDLFKVKLTFPVVDESTVDSIVGGDSVGSESASVGADNAPETSAGDEAKSYEKAETALSGADVISATAQAAEETSSGADSGVAAAVAASVAAAVADPAPAPEPEGPSES